jgi:hypothetical protein
MAENGTAIPGLKRLGHDAEQVAALYPRRVLGAPDAWKAFPVEIPADLNKLADGHCGYGK